MKVYDITKTKILTDYDLEKGYIKPDTITIYYDEVKAVKSQGHYETIRKYPNGGEDVKWVVDVKGTKYQPAREEVEDIAVYVPYTKKELKQIANNKRIIELKELLNNSDYKAIKYAEGELSNEEYAPIREERKLWRAEINQLQQELEQ